MRMIISGLPGIARINDYIDTMINYDLDKVITVGCDFEKPVALCSTKDE